MNELIWGTTRNLDQNVYILFSHLMMLLFIPQEPHALPKASRSTMFEK